MDPAVMLALAVIVFSAGASFFFSLAETALFSLSKWQARQLADRNTHLGAVVTRLLAEPHDVLATMVLGNTFAGASMLAVGLWLSFRQDWPLALTVVSLLLLALLGGEVLPKTLAVRKAELWALPRSPSPSPTASPSASTAPMASHSGRTTASLAEAGPRR